MAGEITIETVARAWREDVAESRAFARGATYERKSEVSFNALMDFVAEETLGPAERMHYYRAWCRDEEGVTIESRCLTHPNEEPQRRRIGLREAWGIATPIAMEG